jgi:hypothetical protein
MHCKRLGIWYSTPNSHPKRRDLKLNFASVFFMAFLPPESAGVGFVSLL